MSNETRSHKDNVFCLLYRDKKNLLSLYNAMNDTSYGEEEELEVVTLDGAICMKIKNDAAFVIDSMLNLYEQQASVNPNMPLRDLYYVARELKKIAPPRSLYSTMKVEIPVPKFVVFYNGTAKQPERQEYRLSDLFSRAEENPELELRVTVININPGYSENLLKRCESLKGYMVFVEKVRGKRKAGIKLESAVLQALEECISENILAEFFRENREEVVEMSIWEFDQELHDKTLLEDGEAIGLEKGIEKGIEKGTLKAIKNIMSTLKLTAEQAMTALRIPETDKRKYADRL
ncbi:hypothetical protein D7X98_04920 [bacterium 1XD8-76]|nr:hypothetical protein D7X98_04920 [bacterium 1XD8-76]